MKIPFFFLKKSKKSLKKSNCSKFFEKNIIRFFSRIFHRKCHSTASKGTKNNQKKISISFRKMSKIHCFLTHYPSVNIKLFFRRREKNHQNIKQKETQRGPLGDHLKDDPASGDKSFIKIKDPKCHHHSFHSFHFIHN